MELMRSEIFGPVVGLSRFKTPDEAVVLANDTSYGLSASIWTKDTRAGLAMASQIQAGTVRPPGEDARSPVGERTSLQWRSKSIP